MANEQYYGDNYFVPNGPDISWYVGTDRDLLQSVDHLLIDPVLQYLLQWIVAVRRV